MRSSQRRWAVLLAGAKGSRRRLYIRVPRAPGAGRVLRASRSRGAPLDLLHAQTPRGARSDSSESKLERAPLPRSVRSPCATRHVYVERRGKGQSDIHTVRTCSCDLDQIVIPDIPNGRVHEGIETADLSVRFCRRTVNSREKRVVVVVDAASGTRFNLRAAVPEQIILHDV